jgi:hypothetical protein
MRKLSLYYATNRGHLGDDRWRPDGYGKKFSSDGAENLRFGKLTLSADEKRLTKHLGKTVAGAKGDGEGLSSCLGKQVKKAKIRAFRENAKSGDPADAVYGSKAMFNELQGIMKKATDVVIYVHGFNVDWNDAVASALALQEMLNLEVEGAPSRRPRWSCSRGRPTVVPLLGPHTVLIGKKRRPPGNPSVGACSSSAIFWSSCAMSIHPI